MKRPPPSSVALLLKKQQEEEDMAYARRVDAAQKKSKEKAQSREAQRLLETKGLNGPEFEKRDSAVTGRRKTCQAKQHNVPEMTTGHGKSTKKRGTSKNNVRAVSTSPKKKKKKGEETIPREGSVAGKKRSRSRSPSFASSTSSDGEPISVRWKRLRGAKKKARSPERSASRSPEAARAKKRVKLHIAENKGKPAETVTPDLQCQKDNTSRRRAAVIVSESRSRSPSPPTEKRLLRIPGTVIPGVRFSKDGALRFLSTGGVKKSQEDAPSAKDSEKLDPRAGRFSDKDNRRLGDTEKAINDLQGQLDEGLLSMALLLEDKKQKEQEAAAALLKLNPDRELHPDAEVIALRKSHNKLEQMVAASDRSIHALQEQVHAMEKIQRNGAPATEKAQHPMGFEVHGPLPGSKSSIQLNASQNFKEITLDVQKAMQRIGKMEMRLTSLNNLGLPLKEQDGHLPLTESPSVCILEKHAPVGEFLGNGICPENVTSALQYAFKKVAEEMDKRPGVIYTLDVRTEDTVILYAFYECITLSAQFNATFFCKTVVVDDLQAYVRSLKTEIDEAIEKQGITECFKQLAKFWRDLFLDIS